VQTKSGRNDPLTKKKGNKIIIISFNEYFLRVLSINFKFKFKFIRILKIYTIVIFIAV